MSRMCRHLNFTLRTLLLAWSCLGCGRNVRADATMVTQAMNASTIAEVSVNDTTIRADLEMGPADFAAFADILSDDLYENVNGKREAARLRQVRFFESGLGLKADDQQISGRMIVLEKRRRIVPDAVTGQPLKVQPQDAEAVLHVALQYDVATQPETLSITPPGPSDSQRTSANVGFMVYHKTLPVTDFRYLSAEETLDLNWDDP